MHSGKPFPWIRGGVKKTFVNMIRMNRRAGYKLTCLVLLSVTNEMSLCTPTGVDTSATPAKRAIWSAEPVVFPPNQPKFFGRYDTKIDHVWDTSV